MKNNKKILIPKFKEKKLLYFRLGLLEEELIEKRGTPIDTLSHYLAKRLSFSKYLIIT